MSGHQMEGLVSLDFRPAKKPRACLHCHVRKVRCNAWEVGIPCTRCKRRNQAATCVLVNASHRRIGSPTTYKRPRTSNVGTDAQVQPSSNARSDGSRSSLLPEQGAENPAQQRDSEPQDVVSTLSRFPADEIMMSPGQGRHSLNASGLGAPLPEFQLTPIQLNETRSTIDSPVEKDDVHLRICQEMSRTRGTAMSPSPELQKYNRREVIEFHEGVNSMTILGEALGHQRPNRLVRVLVAEEPNFNPQHRFPGLDEADLAYIAAKGALDVPPPQICDTLLKIYFSTIYPYAPIVDRVKFMQDYRTDRHSIFLLQSILANTVPHAPKTLLHEAGYKDRITAQRSLFSKARLLYDIGCEKSQLYLLQGSIMLSSLSFSYAMDKDYRYWLTNACRLATQMGLHRNYVSEALEPRMKRLFRRIWWVLYNRDTLLTISGIDNLRRFQDRYCDTTPLTESDWFEDTPIPEDFRSIISPIPTLQKLFMVELSKLSIISGHFLRDFKAPGANPTSENIEKMSDELFAWRKQLPIEMQIGTLQEWSSHNIWILVLLAMSFRLEAVFCRATKEVYRSRNDEILALRTAQRQENAMFELSTIIQRASMHDVLHLCPLSFMTCASTILAMRIEIALGPNLSPRKRLAFKTQIFVELGYIRESCEYWSSLIWTLRMFEAVISRTRLGLTPCSPEEGTAESEVSPPMDTRGLADDSAINASATQTDSWDANIFASGSTADVGMNVSDDVFGILPMTDNYDWLQQLFASEGLGDSFDLLDNVL